MKWWQEAWAWLKRWGGLLLGALLVLVGGGWLWQRQRAQLGRVKDELAVERTMREIARLRGQRAEIASQVGEQDEAVRILDEHLVTNKRELIEAHEHGEGLSDAEVADAFARLGL
jgi:uncharacterized protein HemX